MPNRSNKSPLVSVAIASLWRSLKKDIFDSYRPERHYMRGPGPKWHAKHLTPPQPLAMAGVADAPFRRHFGGICTRPARFLQAELLHNRSATR